MFALVEQVTAGSMTQEVRVTGIVANNFNEAKKGILARLNKQCTYKVIEDDDNKLSYTIQSLSTLVLGTLSSVPLKIVEI